MIMALVVLPRGKLTHQPWGETGMQLLQGTKKGTLAVLAGNQAEAEAV